MKIKLKRLFQRIKNKEFGYIFRRISPYFLPQIRGGFYNNHQIAYNIFIFSKWSRFLNMPKDYSYIIAGSHGVGFVAFIKYMQNLGANPMPLDNMFARSDYVLLARKHAKNFKGKFYGLSIEKAYIDNTRKNILSKLDSKVPIFCLVRDPISIFRTHTHNALMPKLAYGIKNNHIALNRGGQQEIIYLDITLRNQIYTTITEIITFLTKTIIKSKIIPFFCFTSLNLQLQNATKSLYFIDTKDISKPLKSFYSMKNIAKILNIKFENKIDDFSANYSSINLSKHFYIDSKDDENKFYILKDFCQNGGFEKIILEYFNNNIEMKKYIKNYLDFELSIVRQKAPKIMQSWEYYNNFLESF